MENSFSLPGVLFDAKARDALVWQPFREGIEISWLYRAQAEGGPSAAFLRYQPGAHVPRHVHADTETILVLEGAQSDGNGRHEAGTVLVNPAGTSHNVTSEEGCVVLAFWNKPVRFITG